MSQRTTEQRKDIDSSGPTRQTPSYSTGQAPSGSSRHDPHSDAAFDRWTSLVEVCASISPTSLNITTPSRQASSLQPEQHIANNPPFRSIPSLSSMVQAPLSDVEHRPQSNTPSLDINESRMLSHNRKRHACEWCDKAFDRPSTLKTHLLVHTGITPFSCHLCGRRFGVQSNCNRHIRRCAVREELFVARRLEFEALQSNQYEPFLEIQRTAQTRRSNSRSLSPSIISQKPKRPRRKRSPSATWVPRSLASFTIAATCTPAPMPLPPVRPRIAQEERDSYVLYHDQPYTEEGWSGRLPGPAPLFSGSHENLGRMTRMSVSTRRK